ncbi:MAG: hypothetical protein AAGC72_03895 [Planctomycetota bacterium]
MQVDFSVAVVEDNEDRRDTLCDELEPAVRSVQGMQGPFADVDSLVSEICTSMSAATCDHHLISNYAEFNGAEAVSRLYENHLPAVLVTSYEQASVLEIRPYRRNIPVVMGFSDANPDALIAAWSICEEEYQGRFMPTRKPWRAMIRVDDVKDDDVFVFLPGWDSDEVIRLTKRMFPDDLQTYLQPDFRCYTTVNKGAESNHDLYFCDFSLSR